MAKGDFETTYPVRCEGKCRLGPKVLEMVSGVLGANCAGPRQHSSETLVLESRDGKDFAVQPTGDDDVGQLACRNPRLARAVRVSFEQGLDSLLSETTTVKE